MPRCLLVVLLALAVPLSAAQRNCLRQPESKFRPPPPKKRGDGGYRIEVFGNQTKYEPGQRYEVKLVSAQNRFVRKFKGFYLTVEPAVPVDYGMSQHVGLFQPFSSSQVNFQEGCPNTVKHTNDAAKTYVTLMWVAPPPGSGCLVFRATVIESLSEWFSDDQALSYELCEQVRENQDEQPPTLPTCCACDEAKYEVTFEGRWSRNTHPRDFPIDQTAAAFSDIIGASHSAQFRFWEYGGVASEGFRQVAEWGDTKKLENELKSHSDQIRTIIKARGLVHPNLQGRTFAVFRVDRRHHQASLMARIKPSPDWLVGVSAMELCLRNCSWAERQVLNLRPWDAGTKNGDSYRGSFQATSPQQKIQRITSTWPVNSPFYDPTGGEMPALARLVIQRQRVYERQCSSDGRSGLASAGLTDCATTVWGPWGPCSATCGEGRRTRHRSYRNRMHAGISYCQLALEESTPCSASIPCDDYAGYSPRRYGAAPEPDLGYGGAGYSDPDSTVCALDEWSLWGPCSTTCGPGVRTRTRNYKSRLGRKRCFERTTETQDCTAENAPCQSREVIPEGCEVLPWSEWSPCSVSCGESGNQVRVRHFLSQRDPPEPRCQGVKVEDVTTCRPLRANCSLAYSEAVSVCRMPVEPGTCLSSFDRWHFSEAQGRCVRFTYTGCRGNQNNFHTLRKCEETCEAVLQEARPGGSEFGTTYMGPAGSAADSYRDDYRYPGPYYDGGLADLSRRSELLSSSQVINPLLARGARSSRPAGCAVGRWSRWGPCSASCGSGTQLRQRQPLKPELTGTPGCGRHRLQRHRQCRRLPPC